MYDILPDDLWELIQLSGVPINREVSKIVSDVTALCKIHYLYMCILHRIDNRTAKTECSSCYNITDVENFKVRYFMYVCICWKPHHANSGF